MRETFSRVPELSRTRRSMPARTHNPGRILHVRSPEPLLKAIELLAVRSAPQGARSVLKMKRR